MEAEALLLRVAVDGDSDSSAVRDDLVGGAVEEIVVVALHVAAVDVLQLEFRLRELRAA